MGKEVCVYGVGRGGAQELLMSDCDSRGGVTGQEFKDVLWFV